MSITPPKNQPTFAEFNVFDTLPQPVILKDIARHLTAQEALSTRLVCRRFAVLFGGRTFWNNLFHEQGLEVSKAPQNTTGKFLLSSLAKTFPIWICLQKAIDSAVKRHGKHIYGPSSLCIAALAIPELEPLRFYVVKSLEEYCKVSAGLTTDELILRVARGDQGFSVNEGARMLALKSLSKRAAEPSARQALLSVITTGTGSKYSASGQNLCNKAVKALLPYLNEDQVKAAVGVGLQKHGPFAVRPALDTFIANPKVLDAVINQFAGGLCGLDKIVCNRLNNTVLVEQLVHRLTTENNEHVVGQLAEALKPVADQKPVQRALCHKYVHLLEIDRNYRARRALERAIRSSPLADDVKAEYRDLIPMIQELCVANDTSQLTASDIIGRQQLLKALSSQNAFERSAAANVLAPLVPDDPDILAVFLKRISDRDYGEEGAIFVSALARVAHREDVRKVLIGKAPGASVQALRPYIDDPVVRQAFLDRLKWNENPTIRCTLIDILAPQLEKEDVRTLFLEAACDKLWRQSYYSGREWQVAAIDKLGSIAKMPEVENVLLQIFAKSCFRVKAACIRALCSDPQKRLLGVNEIFIACTDSSEDVRREARRVLAQLTLN